MASIKKSKNKKNYKGISFTGERLVQNEPLLRPQRIENLARFKFFTDHIPYGKILDFGCGLGEGTNYLSKKTAYKVVGMDISYLAVHYARREYTNPELMFICGDVLYSSLVGQCFDGIVSIEVLEHLPNVDRYFSEVKRLLKPNGVFMLTTPNERLSSPTVGSLWPDHIKEYTFDELRFMCKKHFNHVIFFGEYIPIYEENQLRQSIRKVSPWVKPLLPKWLRVRALPILFSLIQPNIDIPDVVFTDTGVDKCSTLVAICKEAI